MTLGDITTFLIDFDAAQEAREDVVVDTLGELITVRNLVDHHASVLAAMADRWGWARKRGLRPAEMLIRLGVAPAVASRWLRVGAGLATMPMIAGHSELGGMSGEHADAVVKGFAHIDLRNDGSLDADERDAAMTGLLAQSISGASPAEIGKHARAVANARDAERAEADAEVDADEADGSDAASRVPAAEDRRINEMGWVAESDGRVSMRLDLDVVIAEKIITTIDTLAAPRPEPDGSPDARTVGRRRSEALETVVDVYAQADRSLMGGTPKVDVLLTVPVDAPERAALQFVGPVTAETAKLLACDSTVTEIVVDGESVPLGVKREKRFFTNSQRKALILRDTGCIKCGQRGSHIHGHHIVHWAHGGSTTLDNGCLLCPSCHAAVHNEGWDVVMGQDRHPWLRPPAGVDPRRRLQRSYYRRTLRLDDAA